MNLKQLEAFMRVADTGSFSRAARELYLTQPTVSAHISALEKELGVRLFVRTTKEVRMSGDGEVLYEYARVMLETEKRIREVFEKKTQNRSRMIQIASSSIPAQYVVPDILLEFHRRHPEDQFRLSETDSARVVEKVEANLVDIGFTGTVLEQKQCQYIPFYKDELVLIMPNTEHYQKILKQEKDIRWVQNEPVIMREKGSGTRREAEKMLEAADVQVNSLNIVASIENSESIKRSVRGGIGITIISRLAAREEIRTGAVLEFPMDMMQTRRNLNLVYNRNTPLSPAAERFVKLVKEMYEKSGS
ncbi:MAG TPA: LysR family transcriptional regulator [Candidatus Bariatricus faecipullorum]|nr:LysR family transcriptional regulator [Candidatus Bariatricus faecipullorum]